MAEPTHAEAARLLLHMNGLGTVRRLDALHTALALAYRVGRIDHAREREHLPGCESCLEG